MRLRGFAFGFIGVAHHAFGQFRIIGERRQAAEADSKLVRIERDEGFGCLFHALKMTGIGKQGVKQTRKDLWLRSS